MWPPSGLTVKTLYPACVRWPVQASLSGLDPTVTLERLRLSSVSTLADSVRSPELREKVVATTSPQLVFDTWRSSGSREIKYNCAVTLAYIFLHRDVVDDEWLVPVLSLCCSITDTALQAVCIEAILRRCVVHCCAVSYRRSRACALRELACCA